MSQNDSSFYISPKAAPKPARWLLMDETDLHLCPDLDTQSLHLVGNQPIIRAPGKDEVLYLFASADPFTGEGLYEIFDRKRSEEFSLHLQHLEEMFPEHFLFVGCDNAPAHQSRDTKLFLKDKQDSLELVYLPTYSPNLNGIEPLWALLRKQMTRNKVYESLQVQCELICAWLRSLPFEKLIQTLGTMKKLSKIA